jgi:ribokinase
MGRIPRIIVLGDILYDCFVWADRLPRTGESVIGYDNGFFPGGKGANQAVQAARLGAEVFMVGKVGRDFHGEFVLSKLKDEGINTDYISVDDTVATGTCCVHVARDGSNAIIIAPMANDKVGRMELENAADIINAADAFLVQLQLPPETVQMGLEMAKKSGLITILDPAPPRKISDELLGIADYITPNETESEFFTGIYRDGLELVDWCKKAADVFFSKGVRKVLLTLGNSGIFYSSCTEQFQQACLPAKAIDTTGAGDAFAAAFAFALVQGASLWDAVRYGNGAGSLTVTRRGSQPAMPFKAELDNYLKTLDANE